MPTTHCSFVQLGAGQILDPAGFSLAKDLADAIIAASEKLDKLFGGDSPNGVQSEDSS